MIEKSKRAGELLRLGYVQEYERTEDRRVRALENNDEREANRLAKLCDHYERTILKIEAQHLLVHSEDWSTL